MKKKRQQTQRLLRILSVSLSFAFHAFIKIKGKSEESDTRRAVALREAIEKLGSVFVKFGQFLSIHPALLPPTYCAELFYLLENVPPFSEEAVLKTFQEEFQKKPKELFKTFDLQPFAAASFGQVHKATLPTGEQVVVKVQRPHIVKTVAEDIVLMQLLARILDFFPFGPNKFSEAVKEFETWTKEELDYVTEAAYTEEYTQSIDKKRGDIYAPKVYKQYSNKKILTTEFIEGITFSKILLAIRNNDKKILRQLQEMGFSRKAAATKLTIDSMKQRYVKGFFHGDPHPANIIFTKQGKIAYIDFGICGRLTKKERILCLRYVRFFWMQDFDSSFEALLQVCGDPEIENLSKMRAEFIQLMQDTYSARERRNETGSFRNKNEFQETFRLLQKYKVKMPVSIMLQFRTAIVLRNISFFLDPDIEIEEIAQQFKKISLSNLLSEIPELFSKKNRQAHVASLLNILEKEIIKSI